MKSVRHLALVLFTLLATAVACAAKPLAGPKGGKIITTEAPYAEFFVEPDRKVTVTFYDAALKPVAPGSQVISVIAEAKSGKAQLALEKSATSFGSRQSLPDGDDYTVVVQVREAAGAKPKNYRVLFHDEICKECKRAEYACICDDAGDENHKK